MHRDLSKEDRPNHSHQAFGIADLAAPGHFHDRQEGVVYYIVSILSAEVAKNEESKASHQHLVQLGGCRRLTPLYSFDESLAARAWRIRAWRS
jgi:hypothetical protein